MKTVVEMLNPWEHCPECGALLVPVPGGSLCAHCGYECEIPEESGRASLIELPGLRGEGVRFVLLDQGSNQSELDRVA